MGDVLIWILVLAAFLISYIGLIKPVIPSVLFIWLGVAIYAIFMDAGNVSWWMWLTLIVLTVVVIAADYATSMYFVKKYGATKHGMTAATIGLIVGSFIFPPFGILLVPFLLVFLVEWLQTKNVSLSLKVAFGSFLGFLASSVAKFVIQTVMILMFFIDLWLF